MNTKEFVNEFISTLKKRDIMIFKNDSDCEWDWDNFKNFKLVELLWVTSVEKWILVRLSDKMSRISTLIDKEAKVEDEKIIDTLVDLANYAIILKVYLSQK